MTQEMLDNHTRFLKGREKVSPAKDRQTVTKEGKAVKPLIDGVRIRSAITHVDERGTLCEMYDPAWGFTPEPLVYVYQVTLRPQKIKGWVVHYKQDDRLFFSQGDLKVVLYDDRPDSSTYRMLTEHFFCAHNRAMICIPRGVYHALQNVGDKDVLFINMPTRAYCHEDPDKYRLPLDTDAIPYRFDNRPGW